METTAWTCCNESAASVAEGAAGAAPARRPARLYPGRATANCAQNDSVAGIGQWQGMGLGFLCRLGSAAVAKATDGASMPQGHDQRLDIGQLACSGCNCQPQYRGWAAALAWSHHATGIPCATARAGQPCRVARATAVKGGQRRATDDRHRLASKTKHTPSGLVQPMAWNPPWPASQPIAPSIDPGQVLQTNESATSPPENPREPEAWISSVVHQGAMPHW